MNLFSIIILAIGLSMDSLAASIAVGAESKKYELSKLIALPFSVGIFHLMMIVIGWSLGDAVKILISSIDHWIAFSLLLIVSLKMIYEVFSKTENKEMNLYLSKILLISVATSIDALMVGLSLSFLDISIYWPAIIVGIITFSFSVLGLLLGKELGHILESKAKIFGAIVLLGIGVKILVEHLS